MFFSILCCDGCIREDDDESLIPVLHLPNVLHEAVNPPPHLESQVKPRLHPSSNE
jgi:hypothetical protein